MDGRIDVQNAQSSHANSLAKDARETISKDYGACVYIVK